VTPPVRRGPVVIDTDVFGSDLIPGAALTALYAPILAGRPAIISFQTVAELRYGAMHRGWGKARLLRLEAKLMHPHIEHSGPELVTVCARLRARCAAAGHALGQKHHNSDLWIAATAIRLGVPLVSHDRIFRGVPGLELETVGS
jgi:tRNA(fMet)-specific endonuclease VapC